jgi:hypothetical protein
MKITIVKKATTVKPQGYCMAMVDDVAIAPKR